MNCTFDAGAEVVQDMTLIPTVGRGGRTGTLREFKAALDAALERRGLKLKMVSGRAMPEAEANDPEWRRRHEAVKRKARQEVGDEPGGES